MLLKLFLVQEQLLALGNLARLALLAMREVLELVPMLGTQALWGILELALRRVLLATSLRPLQAMRVLLETVT